MQLLQINNCFILVFVTVEKANAQWGGLGRQWGGRKESTGRQNRSQWGHLPFNIYHVDLRFFSNKSKCKAKTNL